MNVPLRVLIVEDSEDDALLLVRELGRGGFDPDFIRVETPEDLRAALGNREWDIVISDFLMPHFSGLDAFRVVRENGLDLPFIIVSGKIGEDTAVEAMRTGVHDYIMKDNLARLAPAVKRELEDARVRSERHKAEEELRGYREHLEELVRDRTEELSRANAQLQREITERRHAEEELRASEERYRIVSELISDYAYSYRVEPGYKMVLEWLTGASARITGFTQEEISSRGGWSSFVFPDDINIVQRPLRNLLSRQTEEFFEYRIVAKNGEIRWLHESAHSAWDEGSGRVARIYGAVMDITDRKLAEQSLRESGVRYRIFADNTYDWEFWLSPDGKFLYTSPSCNRITGHDAGEFMANPNLVSEIVHAEDRPVFSIHRMEERQKTSGDLEFRIVLPDGSIRWLAHVCQPVFDESGEYLGTRGSNRDITTRKVLESNIVRLRGEYEAFMQHEIRSLFIPMQTYAESLLLTARDTMTGEQITYARKIRESTERAIAFIDNLKRLQDIEAGNYPFQKIDFPLKDIIQREIFNLKSFADSHGATLTFISRETNSNLPLDLNLIPGVFSGLIRNAIEHVAGETDSSERTITTELFNENNSIVVRINNRGIPIPRERLDTFFDKFNADREAKPEGTGLGTTFAALVTRAHGGTIEVTSNEKEGTTVTLRFHIAPVII